MKSSLYLVNYTGLPMTSAPENFSTGISFKPELIPGYILGTKPNLPVPPTETFNFPCHILHAAPGVPAPSGVWSYTVADGSLGSWEVADLIPQWPTGSLYIMEATYSGAFSGMGLNQSGLIRCKMIEVPSGTQMVSSGLVPHLWAGDN